MRRLLSTLRRGLRGKRGRILFVIPVLFSVVQQAPLAMHPHPTPSKLSSRIVTVSKSNAMQLAPRVSLSDHTLPRVLGLRHGLIRRLLGLSLLVVELSLGVDPGADHGDGHTRTVEPVDNDVEKGNSEKNSETLL